jgi:hypothetical protein
MLEKICPRSLHGPALLEGAGYQVGNLVVNHLFEGANLLVAVSPREGYYQLHLRNDYNSRKFRQWFHFKVCSLKAERATFQILNFSKKASLFNAGMQLSVFSSARKQWTRGGTQISYFKNEGAGYSLVFSYQFSMGE